MNAEFTKERWEAVEVGFRRFEIKTNRHNICILDGTKCDVQYIDKKGTSHWESRSYNQTKSDAKLIVQAPAMYQFLTDTIQHLKSKSEFDFVEKHLLNQAEEIIKEI